MTETEKHLTDQENVDPLRFRTEQWKMWKFLQAVVELKRVRIRRAEAVARMSYWSGLDPAICDLMLDGLMLEKRSVFLRSKPKLERFRFDD
jgi:hypothetical protein